MLDRLTGKPVHLYVHLVCCILIAAGLPASKVPLSICTFVISLNLLLEADFKSYWKNLRTNRIAWGLWAYVACEWISLLWTSDWSYALVDLNAKLPLYFICIVLISKPLTELKHLYFVIAFFLASLFVTSVLNVGSYFHWWGSKSYDDIRGLSLFASHIRYGLMIGMGIALAIVWFARRLPYRIIPVMLILWWTWYTYLSQVISGYVAIAMVLFAGTLFLIHSLRNRTFRWGIVCAASLAVIAGVWWTICFFQPTPHKIRFTNPPQYTANGNWYRHDTAHVIWENGYPVVAFISDEELSKAWNAQSDIDYTTGRDKKEHAIAFTLWRYMASKGLTKDSLGFLKMTTADIRNVENGIASVMLAKGGLSARLHGIKHQLEHPEDPNGHSLLQRIEYWKAARHIIGRNMVFGVGAGDVQQAFEQYYRETDTQLEPDLQRRAHNQFLTSWISSGLPGLCAFLAWWILLLRMAWKRRLFIVLAFAAIALSSFLTEDTLETQVGVTFIAFFYALFVSNPMLLLGKWKN
jgi:hypothetical protein